MLTFVINLIFCGFIQGDSLDIIYDQFYENQEKYREQVNLITDKDLYFPGENLSFIFQVNSSNVEENIKSRWAYLFLFDEKKQILAHDRFFLNKGTSKGSFLIPDSVTSDLVHLALYTEHTQPSIHKSINLINENNQLIEEEYKVVIHCQNKFLTPNRPNKFLLSSNYSKGVNGSIVNIEGEIKKEFWIRGNKLLDIEPEINQTYFLKIDNQTVPFPPVRQSVNLNAELNGNLIKIGLENIQPENQENILMVTAGKEILWLSNVKDSGGFVEVPLDDVKSSYVLCMVLDKDFEVLCREIIERETSPEKLNLKIIKDTLLLDIPDKYKGQPFAFKAVESNYHKSQIKFNINEISELSYFGKVPMSIRFRSNFEKTTWLKYNFKIDIKSLLKGTNSANQLSSTNRISYTLPKNIEPDEHLIINAVDIKNRIINYEIEKDRIVFDPSTFEFEESTLILNAKYKNSTLKLTKDTTSQLEIIKTYVDKLLSNKSYFNTELEHDYSNINNKLEGITILEEVGIAGKRNTIKNSHRAQTVTFEKNDLINFKNSIVNILQRVGLYQLPNDNGHILLPAYGFTNGVNQKYYVYLIIPRVYSGYDFRILNRYPASWVKSISKTSTINSQTVSVIVDIDFKREEKFIYLDKIFKESMVTNNFGVHYWKYHDEGDRNNVLIPINGIEGSISWTLFFPNNGKSVQYDGVYGVIMKE